MTIVYHDKIEAGEVFKCKDRSVVVTGTVGEGAHIKIEGGGVLINGDVGDNVIIEVSGAHMDRGTIGGRADVIPGIFIEGSLGSGAQLKSDESIYIEAIVGTSLKANVRKMFAAAAVGDHARITADKVTVNKFGKDCATKKPAKPSR